MDVTARGLLAALLFVLQWTRTELSEAGLHTSGPTERQSTTKLVVTTKLDAPYMMLKKGSPFLMGNDRFEGFLADLILRLSESIGFEYTIRLVSDGQYSGKGENNTWKGIIGQLSRGDADIGLAPLVKTDERSEVVDFTVPFMSFRYTALLKKPRRRRSRIKTLTELLQHWEIKTGFSENSLLKNYFKKTSNPTHARMWALMTNIYPSVFVQSTEEGVDRARRENYAYLIDVPKARYLVANRPCDLYMIEPFLEQSHFSLALSQGSRWKSVLDAEIQRMHRTGQLELIQMRWWRNHCTRGRVTKARNAKGAKTRSGGLYGHVTESRSRVTAIPIIEGENHDGATVNQNKKWTITVCLLITTELIAVVL